jgi:hypothetical protein
MDGWPTQREVPEFYGARGANQVLYTPAYPFYLYDGGQRVKRISVHEKVVDSLDRVLTAVLNEYGEEAIHELHLDRYFGSLNVRKMRGGNSWSMHSWGIAIDFDANRNQLRWNHTRAAFARPEYDAWWQCWEAEGWTSLGRERDYDWMHVQAASLE